MVLNKQFYNSFARIVKCKVLKNSKFCSKLTTQNKKDTHKYLKNLVKFIRNCTYWSRFNKKDDDFPLTDNDIKGKTLHQKHMEYVQYGVYDEFYKYQLTNYFKRNRCSKLKYLSIDTTFVPNKLGTENISHNGFYHNKTGIKISFIVDANGVPIAIRLFSGNISDNTSFEETYQNLLIDLSDTDKYKHTKYERKFLCDSAYDSLRQHINELGYDAIIPQNKRNTKNQNKKIHMTNKEKKHYANRKIVENTNSWIKQYPILNFCYEKTLISYMGLLLLALSIILFNKIQKEKTSETDEEKEKKIQRKENDKQKKKIKYKELQKKQKEKIKKKQKREHNKEIRKEKRNIEIKNCIDQIIKEINNITTINNKSIIKKVERISKKVQKICIK